jgi:peptidoglycan/LPS O-acetylase OafA/YrhL
MAATAPEKLAEATAASAARPEARPQPTAHSAWIPQLDGLRGIAALSVVAHFNTRPFPLDPAVTTVYGATSLLHTFSVAPMAVVAFYALSAFLLTHLAVREYDAAGRFGVRRFYTRRVLRIWPLYFTVVAVNLLAAIPGGPLMGFADDNPTMLPWMLDHWWLYVGFLTNWSLAFNYVRGHIDMGFPGVAVLWSITVEEQFYLLYAPLMLLALRGRRPALLVLIGWRLRRSCSACGSTAPSSATTTRP